MADALDFMDVKEEEYSSSSRPQAQNGSKLASPAPAGGASSNSNATAPSGGSSSGGGPHEEREITDMKRRVLEMEEEADRLREMQATLEKEGGELAGSEESKEDIDNRSVFVGNVDYSTSPEELQAHFQSCGSINRVTILLDKYTGQPKGFAYVEFSEPSLVAQALVLNESIFKGRNLKVVPKRTNLPGMSRGRGRGGFQRGRGGPFGHGPRGGYAPRAGYRGGYRGRARGFTPY